MNRASQQASHVRRRRFIDPHLQGRLIIVLVLLQACLLAGILYWLFGDLEALLEARLYRIHQSDNRPMAEVLLAHSAPALAGLLLANMALMALAELVWARRLRRLAGSLARLTAQSAQLDFSADTLPTAPHAVHRRALAWRRWEAARLAKFRASLRQLAETPSEQRPILLAHMRRLLQRNPEPDRQIIHRA
jgi:hypothetical protein